MTALNPLNGMDGYPAPPARLRRAVRRLGNLPSTFAILAFLVGSFLVFAQPPGQGLDETAHFDRIWTLSQGDLVVPVHHQQPGGYVPKCVTEYLNGFSAQASNGSPYSFGEYWKSPGSCSERVFTGVGTASANNPISYAPSLLAVWFLRAIGASLPLIFFGGRLASLLGFIALFYLAIRLIPIGKQVLFVFGLLPITLLLASSYSADPMTISLAALAVALVLRCRLSPGATLRTAGLLGVVLVGLCLTKPALFVFAPLVFMVPDRLVDRVRPPLVMKAGAFAIIVGLAGLWYLAVRHEAGFPVPLFALNPHTQTRYILDHPFGYIEVLARTFFVGTGENKWLPGLFFSTGYQRTDDPYAPVGLVIVGSLTLFYAFQLQVGARRLLDRGTRALAWVPIGLMAVGIVLVETTLFVYGTPVGSLITDAQGRYFIPLLFLLLASIGLLRQPRAQLKSTRWILLGVVVMLVWLVLKIFVHDYSL
jgi:uncharacterized membrane protein